MQFDLSGSEDAVDSAGRRRRHRAGPTFTAARPAPASADKREGDAYANCVVVNGRKPHFNFIKSRVAWYAKACRYGHGRALVNGKHSAQRLTRTAGMSGR